MTRLRRIIRRLAQTPGFTLISVLTLAVGIAATTTIFGVVKAVLLRPLPYPEPERLIVASHAAPGLDLDEMGQSDATFLRYRADNHTLEGIAAYDEGTVSLTRSGDPERLGQGTVTASLFSVLRVFPVLGRAFDDGDEAPGAPPVVILTDGLWQRRFGGSDSVLGRLVELDGVSREVVGVMPPGFEFPSEQVELWLPMTLDPEDTKLGSFGMRAVARLRDGVSEETARADLEQILGNPVVTFPDQDAAAALERSGFTPLVSRLRDDLVGEVKARLWILLGTVVFVLLIACANVTNLFLVRGEGRRRENAVRTALGATRGELVSDALAESLSIAFLAGGVGAAGAWAGMRLLVHYAPRGLPRVAEIGLHAQVLLFAAAVALLIGLVLGLIPNLRSHGRDLSTVLREGGRSSTAGRGRLPARHLLVGFQVALALVLLIGCGLMVRSYISLADVDPGFSGDDVIAFQLSLPESEYPDEHAVARFYQQATERLESLPGASSAGAVSALPLGGRVRFSGLHFKDFPLEEGDPPPILGLAHVAPGYFRTMNIPLREGRDFEPADHQGESCSVIVNESLARRRWPGGSALGKAVFPGRPEADGDHDPWCRIAGVVGDVHLQSLTEEPEDVVYYAMVSSRQDLGGFYSRHMSLVVRAAGSPTSLVELVRGEIRTLDPSLPIADVRTVGELVRRSRAPMAFTLVLLVVAAAAALLLGAVGTFGVLSYLVTQRTSEIGIRMALGASPGTVLGLVMGRGLLLTAGGAAVGLAGSLVLSSWMEAILFEVSRFDLLTFCTVPAILLLVALLATWLPARRASRIDPVVALRHE